jgi:hypothetical protein
MNIGELKPYLILAACFGIGYFIIAKVIDLVRGRARRGAAPPAGTPEADLPRLDDAHEAAERERKRREQAWYEKQMRKRDDSFRDPRAR